MASGASASRFDSTFDSTLEDLGPFASVYCREPMTLSRDTGSLRPWSWCRSATPAVAVVTALFLGVATPAIAQFDHSGLSGTVTSDDGAPIEGVVVSARHSATGRQRSVKTGRGGTYAVAALKPGSYVVSLQRDGFTNVTFNDVELRLGQTTQLSGVLEPASVTDSITVTARPHVIDLDSHQLGDTLIAAEFTDLPTQNRSFVLFAGLVPGVVPNPQTNSSSNDGLYINGQHQANNSFRVDGALNDDDIVRSQAGAQVRIPIEAIQEFQVLTSQYDAEYGGATGGVLNAVIKSGTNSVTGTAFGFFQRAEWNEQDFFGKRAGLARPRAQFRSAGFTVGGPIRRDSLHFFVSVESVDDQEGHTRVFNSRPELNFSATEANEVRNILGRVDFQMTERQHVSLRVVAEDAPQRNKIVGTQASLEGARAEDDSDFNAVAGLETLLSENAINSLRISYVREHLISAASPFGQFTTGFEALQNVGPLLDRPSVDEGPSVLGLNQESRSFNVADSVTLVVPRGNTMHEVRAGVQWARRSIDNRQFGFANGRFDFDTDRPFDADDITTYPFAFMVRLRGAARGVASGAETFGVFVQDDFHVRPNLTLSAGLRWDREDVVSDDNNVSPRVGFAWSPGGSTRTSVRGGSGRFYGHFPLGPWSLFQNDAVDIIEGGVFRVPDAGANRQFFFDLAQAHQIRSIVELRDLVVRTLEGQPITQFNSSPTVDHRGRVQPHVDTITLGTERELFRGVAAGVDLVHSESRNTLLLVDLNPFSRARGGRPNISIRNGVVVPMGSINTFVNAGTNRYKAVQVSLRKRTERGFGGRIAYTLSDSEGTYGNAGPFGAPNTAYFQTRSETGYNFDTGEIIGEPLRLNLKDARNDGQPVGWHRRHNFVMTGVWEVPRTSWREGAGLSVSGLYRYMSGDRFTIFTTQLLDNGNRAPAAPGTYDATVASDIGRTNVAFGGGMFGAENPAFSRLDLSLRYDVPLPYADARLTLIGDVFNATGRTNFVNSGGTITGSTGFLTPTAALGPREFQLGARLSF